MNFIIFHSEKNFIISGVCLSGVRLVRSLSCQEFVLSRVCLSGVCHGTIHLSNYPNKQLTQKLKNAEATKTEVCQLLLFTQIKLF